jgi:hypothetical protein
MGHPKCQVFYDFYSYVLLVAVAQMHFQTAHYQRRLCAGRFRALKYDLSGGNRELLASTAVLANVLQYVMPFLACFVLFSFAIATILNDSSILIRDILSKVAQDHSGTPWTQVCFWALDLFHRACSKMYLSA